MKVLYGLLKTYTACFQREVVDRLYHDPYYDVKITPTEVNRLLESDPRIQTIKKELPIKLNNGYSSFKFYYLKEEDPDKVDQVINYKMRLMHLHQTHRRRVEQTQLDMIVSSLKNLGVDSKEIELRKKIHGGVGIGRMDADVFCPNPVGIGYLHIESKNRKQWLAETDINKVRRTRNRIISKWNLEPVLSAIVCSYIYPKARELSEVERIPVVYTGKVYVPNTEFYRELKEATGGNYIAITSGEIEILQEKVGRYIFPYLLEGLLLKVHTLWRNQIGFLVISKSLQTKKRHLHSSYIYRSIILYMLLVVNLLLFQKQTSQSRMRSGNYVVYGI